MYDITKAAVLGIYNPNIQPKLMVAIKRKVISIFRAWFYSYFNNFVTIDEILSPYVLVTLHLQPEASIDVVGAKFSNQTEFVRQLVRTAPSSHLLLIKEHPHAFGDRKPDFYEFLDAMPNVKILAPFEDSRKAILGADLVVSTTGTSSLEAAIMGVPAVTAVEMFYKQLMVEPSFDPACNNLSDLLIKAKKWRGQIYTIEMVYDAIKRIQASTFSGNSGDFKTDPHVMSDENILKLRSMFLEIIENHKDIL